MGLGKEDIEHVSKLARLPVTPEEGQKLMGPIAGLWEYFRRLQELDTTGVEPSNGGEC